jgi:hypothetical protein
MKFNIGDHLQEIGSIANGIVKDIKTHQYGVGRNLNEPINWYLIENDELGLVNHWVPEYKLELHKQPLRNSKLKELGI